MAQKVTIDGVEREISSGFTTVGGVKKEITKGIVLINGVRYEIPFATNLKITVTGEPEESVAFFRILKTDKTYQDVYSIGTYEYEDVIGLTILAISQYSEDYSQYGVFLNGESLNDYYMKISSASESIPLVGTIRIDYSTENGFASRLEGIAKVSCSLSLAKNLSPVTRIVVTDIPTSAVKPKLYVGSSSDAETLGTAGTYSYEEDVSLVLPGYATGYLSWDTEFNDATIEDNEPIECIHGHTYYIKWKILSRQQGSFMYYSYNPRIYDDTYYGWMDL